ncbi:MAG: DUF3617 family protein [Sphingomonas sp.]
MRKTMMTAGIAAMMLGGCAKGPPPKREPGSWSQTMELKRFEGNDAEKAKAALGQMFAAMNAVTICVSPEMAAKEDPTANLEKLGSGGGTCTFDKKSADGGYLDIAGTCKDTAGKSAKITATGTLSASDQDVNMTVEGYDTYGAKEGVMEIRVHSVRKGECTAGDMRPKTM